MHHRPTPNCVSSPLNVWVSAAGIPGSTQMEEKWLGPIGEAAPVVDGGVS